MLRNNDMAFVFTCLMSSSLCFPPELAISHQEAELSCAASVAVLFEQPWELLGSYTSWQPLRARELCWWALPLPFLCLNIRDAHRLITVELFGQSIHSSE